MGRCGRRRGSRSWSTTLGSSENEAQRRLLTDARRTVYSVKRFMGKGIDDEVYAQRITPRKAGSIWSAVNIAKAAAFTEAGLMYPAGLAAFEARREDRSAIYSHEQDEPATLSVEQEAVLRQNERLDLEVKIEVLETQLKREGIH